MSIFTVCNNSVRFSQTVAPRFFSLSFDVYIILCLIGAPVSKIIDSIHTNKTLLITAPCFSVPSKAEV